MKLNLKEKKEIVSKIKKNFKTSLSVVIANFCGVSANNINSLRKSCRESEVKLQVARNTLINLVFKDETIYKNFKKTFVGPSLIAFSKKHPGSAARLFKKFSTKNNEFKIKGAYFLKKFIPNNQIDILATIPTYEEAIIKMILIMKEASHWKLMRIIMTLRDNPKVLNK